MSETTSACIRGCSLYRQHLVECEGVDVVGGECRGCLPRRASVGHLCSPCHRRLELMLTDAPTVVRWLTGNISKSTRAAANGDASMWDGDRPELGSDQPLPISAAIFDLRNLLVDRLTLWSDDWAEHKGLSAPRHTIEADSAFLLMWLPGVCKLDWIGDWWEEIAETMRDAHALAPWRPEMRRVRGVACPGCSETNLAIFGGESDVTCLSCKIIMTEQRYDLWERVLKMEQEVAS